MENLKFSSFLGVAEGDMATPLAKKFLEPDND